ncbi:MAG: ATP-grasp domain-containing protein [Hahellaceae bacterium]|nr:ATP-grasp domain-containing protein [Hahellaceae bacterium]
MVHDKKETELTSSSTRLFNQIQALVQLLRTGDRKVRLRLEEAGVNLKDTDLRQFIRFSPESNAFLQRGNIEARLKLMSAMTGDEYRDAVIEPVEGSERWSAPKVVKSMAAKVYDERKHGSLYLAQCELETADGPVVIGIMAQNRKVNNGVWGADHHRQAISWARDMESRNRPIVTFMDTPGADAGVDANLKNQAHSISALIAAMTDLSVPVIGVVLGVGYSGGAIPLAAGNALLAARDALFSTIQPKGLAAISRKQRLSWQACAQHVGVSAAELVIEGVVDGIVDYSPAEGAQNIANLRDGIVEALRWTRKAAVNLVNAIPDVASSYTEEGRHYCSPTNNSPVLHQYKPEGYPSLIDSSAKLQKTVLLRSRLTTATIAQLRKKALPQVAADDSEDERLSAILASRFTQWFEGKDRLIYEDSLLKVWKRFQESQEHRGEKRSYMAALLFGDPENEYEKSFNDLCYAFCFSLYNRWQGDAVHHLKALIAALESDTSTTPADQIAEDQLTVVHVLRDPLFRPVVVSYCRQLIQLDRLYEVVLDHMTDIVTELAEAGRLSREIMGRLLDDAGISGESRRDFLKWLVQARDTGGLSGYMQSAEHWKRSQHSRMSEVLFVVVSYFFDRLYPDYQLSLDDNKSFSGQFTPVSIGRRKDFWNRLVQAEKDLRIQAVLNDVKPSVRYQPEEIIEKFFSGFRELDAELTTANPRSFPGFGEAAQKQALQTGRASGVITGVANFSHLTPDSGDTIAAEIGVLVSNHGFQAGAFDMSSAERFCRLLTYCAQHRLPVVCFVCSGGMQTKEGASALFSMAAVNDHINRFVMQLGLPVLVFGYGDCTGGAQASFVTHPLVQTWYFSGTNMPFAGRIVVPDFLPVTATLSNYLLEVEGSMQGIVKHPFIDDLDERLQAIDPDIYRSNRTVDEVVAHWLQKRQPMLQFSADGEDEFVPPIFGNFEQVLVHARGCTAVKLVQQVQAANYRVLLVQSDPDMESVAADMLGDNDDLVCLGGFTSDESYLNGESVLRIAKLHGVEALHPGIGFLSENSDFARKCLQNNVNFIGPSPESMAAMGDKSQAIKTALKLGVPVVPGSHGLLTDENQALVVARQIGFPIILKAAHGGGGKGIVVVENEESFIAKFLRIKAEARSSFGRDDIYLERFVTRFRHIEVQLLRDSHGNTKVVGLRDCSVQRNKQKIIEESASTLLPAEKALLAKECAAQLAEACNYHGAGTIEYIYDLDRDQLYFMEMNTRLQVEHPVTELVSGVNIVFQQFEIAKGKSIADLEIGDVGYAFEVRINAERVSVKNSEISVEPTPGKVERCEFPERQDITRIVTVAAGKSVPPYYDNLIAQLVSYGKDRNDAIAKMLRYLKSITLEGISSNIPLLTYILQDEVFLSGDYDTDYLPGLAQRKGDQLSEHLAKWGRQVQVTKQLDIQVEGSDELKVFAPSNSILYQSPAPNKPSFVKEGDIISVTDTLCLLEVMKMFQPLTLGNFNSKNNELYPAGSKFEVTHIKGVDGQQINKDDLLFVVRPVASA